jgi:hypothetical protein
VQQGLRLAGGELQYSNIESIPVHACEGSVEQNGLGSRQDLGEELYSPITAFHKLRDAADRGHAHQAVRSTKDDVSIRAPTAAKRISASFPKGDGRATFYGYFLDLAIREERDPFPIGRKGMGGTRSMSSSA